MASKLNSPRKNTKLFKLIVQMIRSLRPWRYMEMAEFGFYQNHDYSVFDKKANRGYWSVNIRHAVQSGYIYKQRDGSYSVTWKCFQNVINN